MRRFKLLLLFAFLGSHQYVFAQQKDCEEEIREAETEIKHDNDSLLGALRASRLCDSIIPKEIRDKWDVWGHTPDCPTEDSNDGDTKSEIVDNFALLDDFTFDRMLGRSYAKALTDDNAFSAASSFATISVDKESSTGTFAYAPDIRDKSGYFNQLFWNAGVKLAVNGESIFKVWSRNKGFAQSAYSVFLNLNIPLSHKVKFSRIYTPDSATIRSEEDCAIRKICDDYSGMLDKNKKCENILDYLDKRDAFNSVEEYEKAIRNKFSDYEEKILKPYLTRMSKWWLTVTPSGGLQILERIDTTTKKQDNIKPGFVAMRASINYLRTDLDEDNKKQDMFFFSLD